MVKEIIHFFNINMGSIYN